MKAVVMMLASPCDFGLGALVLDLKGILVQRESMIK